MQYLAILDAEGFEFLDGERKRWVEIAWRYFNPHRRTLLEEPVAACRPGFRDLNVSNK